MIRITLAVFISISIANAGSFARFVQQQAVASCPAATWECPK